MKRKIALFAVLLTTLAAGVFGIYSFWPDPPIDTKFAPSVKEGESENAKRKDEIENSSVSRIKIKKPGNYALLENPKHVYQTFNNCGPATLSMMLSWYGETVSQKDLGDKMRPHQVASGDNDDKTIFTYEFVDWAKKYGFGQ